MILYNSIIEMTGVEIHTDSSLDFYRSGGNYIMLGMHSHKMLIVLTSACKNRRVAKVVLEPMITANDLGQHRPPAPNERPIELHTHFGAPIGANIVSKSIEHVVISLDT